jgi:hypothetical protein
MAMSIRKCVVAMMLSIVAPVIAGGQSVSAVRVVKLAAVLEQPVGDARSLGSVGTGEILDVLDERTGWYLVRPAAGSPAREWRTGWVSAATVEPMGPGAPAATAKQATVGAAESPERTASRKGFIIGVGAGGGLHRTPSFSVFDRFGRPISSGGGTNNFAIVTNFLVGWAPTDRVLLFYSNKATFTTDENYDALGVTGFGATYMFRPTSPSAYVTGSIGGGFGASVTGSTASDVGLGWSAGVGWEFRRHLSLEGDVLMVQLGSGQDHTVYRGVFTYTFY